MCFGGGSNGGRLSGIGIMFEAMKSSVMVFGLIYFALNRISYNNYMAIQGPYIDKKLTHVTFENFLFSNEDNIRLKYIVISANFVRILFFISFLFNAISIKYIPGQFFIILLVIFAGFSILNCLYELVKQISTVCKERNFS
jgi:hypothetical protein